MEAVAKDIKPWWSFKSITELIRYWRLICTREPNYVPENVSKVLMEYDGWGNLRGDTANEERTRLIELYLIIRKVEIDNQEENADQVADTGKMIEPEPVKTGAKVIDKRGAFNQGRRGKAVAELEALIAKYELTYDEFIEFGKIARERMQLVRKKRQQVSKPVPSLDDVKTFLRVVARHSVEHTMMMKILIFMGIRSCELVRIKLSDIDLTPGAERMFLRRKAGLDGVFVIPKKLADLLSAYLDNPERQKQVYLFEKSYHKPYSEQAGTIRKLVQKYRMEAGLDESFHPHNFRHLLLTTLGGDGWTDTELQRVSGHKSRTSLDTYIERNAEVGRNKYNDSVNRILAEV